MHDRNEAMWMKYDEFVNCFTYTPFPLKYLTCHETFFLNRTLYVFHKPGGYEFKRAIQDMKVTTKYRYSSLFFNGF